MIVKKFQAQTETDAIKKAQEDLGNKAVVLNVKTVKQRGISKIFKKDYVEITAALEEEEFTKDINKSSVSRNQTKLSSEVNTTIDLIANEPITVNTQSSTIEQKLDSLHSLLQSQIDMKNNTSGENEKKIADEKEENSNMKFIKLIYKKLIDNEVDEKYADMIMGDIENSLKKESTIDSILAAAYQKIILKLGELDEIKIEDKKQVIFFIGPTGVGKTTTIAKIASRFKLEKDTEVAFITADTYRVAAVEQLNTYASIIDSPVEIVYSADEIKESINALQDYDIILVDTAGRSHKCEEQMDELSEMLNTATQMKDEYDIKIYLVLSSTTKYKDLINIVQRYKDIDSWSLIFTKLDETCALGNVLNVRMLTGAPLSYTTSGQNVPNDIELINKQALAKQLLGGN